MHMLQTIEQGRTAQRISPGEAPYRKVLFRFGKIIFTTSIGALRVPLGYRKYNFNHHLKIALSPRLNGVAGSSDAWILHKAPIGDGL